MKEGKPLMKQAHSVQQHYTNEGLPGRLEAALQHAGYGSGPIPWSVMAQFDQFHMRGLQATAELAESLGLRGGESVLDLGSGIGGPARYLAAVHGCQVTGIELTPMFVQLANTLSQRAGLAHRTRFVQGDATDLPFRAGSFDHAITEHVAMHIPNKDRFYAGVHRVLKPGGRFAIYDPVRGDCEPVIYPVPWAKDAGQSFLASAAELMEALRAAGLREAASADLTDLALAWAAELAAAPPPPEGAVALTPAYLMGPELRQAIRNLSQNLAEGRVRLFKVVVQKTQ
jgi:ubiquinone/menaquinone biosynthesis C-methylase UbiE